jgi:hypothetical protein
VAAPVADPQEVAQEQLAAPIPEPLKVAAPVADPQEVAQEQLAAPVPEPQKVAAPVADPQEVAQEQLAAPVPEPPKVADPVEQDKQGKKLGHKPKKYLDIERIVYFIFLPYLTGFLVCFWT